MEKVKPSLTKLPWIKNPLEATAANLQIREIYMIIELLGLQVKNFLFDLERIRLKEIGHRFASEQWQRGRPRCATPMTRKSFLRSHIGI